MSSTSLALAVSCTVLLFPLLLRIENHRYRGPKTNRYLHSFTAASPQNGRLSKGLMRGKKRHKKPVALIKRSRDIRGIRCEYVRLDFPNIPQPKMSSYRHLENSLDEFSLHDQEISSLFFTALKKTSRFVGDITHM